jgi:tetratricopeptide (TPR) repeat protein
MNNIRYLICTFFLCVIYTFCFAQSATEIEVKKPAKYENRKLRSEKTGEKKFTPPRHIFQNTVTHYNYYFNANTRLNEVIARAKASFKDDYSKLLPFYNYTLETTAKEKVELDSIIYKCTAGILLHDLRNDWIDNMYLLMGKTYLLRNDLDSAGLTFQYINYAFAPKEDGYDIPIGSNSSNETGEFSIATKEKNSLWKKLTAHPESRNESFVWAIRNHVEKDELPEAAGIMEILRNDPNFPKRLDTELNEVIAYWFYKQQVFDSSAFYLSKSLNEAQGKQERARWEYLIGQMYQLSGKNEDAIKYYDKSIGHTNDPVMDVYARLNSIRINGGNDQKFVDKNIAELEKMAKRDKYENHRDIIYFAAAKIELGRNNFDAAQNFLLKSVKYTVNNPMQRSESFLLLGDLNYARKAYPQASSFYDSIDVASIVTPLDKERVETRKPPLRIIAVNDLTIDLEDSLQSLAKMPAEQREAFLKKKARELRKAQGLKEEDIASTNPAIKTEARDLFGENKSGAFYFYNPSLKSKGFSEFKSKWGQRPNVDNWRRQSAINKTAFASNANPDISADDARPDAATDMSYEGLLAKVPLTEEQLTASNKKIMDALYTEAKTFLEALEDYPTAIDAFEELLRRFPNTTYKSEAYFNLAYAYEKSGNKEKAAFYKNQLNNVNDKWTQLAKKPAAGGEKSLNNPATKKYQDIYNMFIEGRFEEAKQEKKVADSIYGKSYWSPQLLFIESIYYVKQKEDSTAIRTLGDLATLHASSPMAERAKTMISVLKRRKEIEDELTRTTVIRNEDGTTFASNNSTKPASPAATITVLPAATSPDKKDTASLTTAPEKDDVKTVAPVTKKDDAPPIANKTFSFVPTDAQYVLVVLDKVDEVFASEARNAFNRYNKEKFYSQNISVSGVKLDARFSLVLQGPFADANAAVDYIDKTKPVTRSRILPWLTTDKYNFSIISSANLDVLKANKDMDGYKQLLQTAFPGKF